MAGRLGQNAVEMHINAPADGRVWRSLQTNPQAARHIVSTIITNMGGFLPLILAGGGFWPPFAMAVAGGVALSLAFAFTPQMFALTLPRNKARAVAQQRLHDRHNRPVQRVLPAAAGVREEKPAPRCGWFEPTRIGNDASDTKRDHRPRSSAIGNRTRDVFTLKHRLSGSLPLRVLRKPTYSPKTIGVPAYAPLAFKRATEPGWP